MIFLDLETTGLNPEEDKIIEFAAIKVDEDLNELSRMDFVCNPWIPVKKTILNLTWISQSEIDKAGDFISQVDKIKELISPNDIIVWHNIKFDINFLNIQWLLKNNDHLDTYVLANIFLPWHESYALEVLSDVLDLHHDNKHRAMWDVIACIEILKVINKEIKASSKWFIDEINKSPKKFRYINYINKVLWVE